MAIYGNMEFRKIGRFKWFVSCSISSFKTAGFFPNCSPSNCWPRARSNSNSYKAELRFQLKHRGYVIKFAKQRSIFFQDGKEALEVCKTDVSFVKNHINTWYIIFAAWCPSKKKRLVLSGQVASLRQKSGDVLALVDHSYCFFLRWNDRSQVHEYLVLKDSIEAGVPRIYVY